MYLKSLEVQGFKSFPDKTLIRFGDDITAIVGPNGSGKSNISDAILWVMGEQSSKTLRGAKMEDVIFGGTQKRSAVGFAEATLTLDNADRALPYDADQVMVTRRYYRSGDSEYYINRQSARLRDIHEMFMDTGLGREGYSNIGQGRIDEILSLKSADRREIFEEAAGISKYRHRKEETERKLQHTQDNLLRIGDKVSELELQLEPLKQQSEKARKYLELKQELRSVEVAVWLDTLEKLSAAARKAEEDHATASFLLQQANEELEGLYTRSQTLGQDLRDRDGELETLRQKVNMLESAYQQLDGRLAVLRGTVENNDGNAERIRQELQGQQDRSGGIARQLEQARERVEQIGLELEELARTAGRDRDAMAQMTANAQGLTREFLELRREETELTGRIAAGGSQLEGLEEALALSSERKQTLEQNLAAGEQRLEEVGQALSRCCRELRQAREEVTAAQNTITGYSLRQQTRVRRREELEEQLRGLNGRLEGIQAKVRVFRAMERDFESYQRSVKLVMQEAQRGGLRNVHGPVSRLIRTEDSYTLAIEIALGAAMQQIVVSSESDGKAAIQYLKRAGGGRATFLPLSVIKGRPLQEQGLDRCRGFVGLGSALVSCQEQYRQVVENLLGRTVIAENMDCALEMANRYGHRFRIVTLDGQVLNAGGSMTGGSVNREAGILSRANELEKLIKEQNTLERDREALQEQLQEARRSAEEVTFQITAAGDKLRQAQDTVLTLQGQEKQHLVLTEALEEAAEASEQELRALRAREKLDRERKQTLQREAAALGDSLASVRNRIALLEGSQTQAAQALARIQEAIAASQTAAAALEAERDTGGNHIRELERLQQAMEGDRENKLDMIRRLREENASLEEQISGIRDLQADNRREVAGHQEQIQKTLTLRSETEATRTRCERDIQEMNKDILAQGRACALLEQKKATTALEERQIVDKLWESYELTPGTAAQSRGQIESVAAGNRRIGELKRKISGLGTPNLGAIEEYARVNERYSYLSAQLNDVLTSKRELESIIRSITQEMTAIFTTEFKKIDHFFSLTFREMFGGGKGELVLDNPQEPLTCGIEIRVQPPGKQVKTITLLSGGEKAFVAIALYFAILKVRPTPFCMLDEIDAALDDRNVERFAAYLRGLSGKTQFIVITHRRGTMEASDVLYGVTMQEQGVSKLLRLDLNQMEEYLGIVE